MEENVILGGMAAVPFITAALQAVKRLSFITTEMTPFIAVLLGVAWNVSLTVGTEEFTRADIFLGIVIGLAASGLYSAGSTVVGEVRERRSDDDDPPAGPIA